MNWHKINEAINDFMNKLICRISKTHVGNPCWYCGKEQHEGGERCRIKEQP